MRVRYTILMSAWTLSLSSCGGQRVREPIFEGLVTRRDSVMATGVVLMAAVQQIDSIGRILGEVQDSSAAFGLPQIIRTDAWGQNIRFALNGSAFDLVSPGSDGVLGTADDIIMTGRIGRSLPCERRDEYGSSRFEDLVDPCEQSPSPILSFCPALLDLGAILITVEADSDPVQATGRRLVRFARIIDGVGRERGGLPPSLTSVPGHPHLPGWNKPDAWGTPIRYERAASRFVLRSAGADLVFTTSDDMIVEGELGRPADCNFRIGERLQHCVDPTPAC